MTAPLLVAQIQGQGTVSADNLNTYIQNCTNIEQLRLFIGLPGMCVFIDGTVAPGDGGAGPFYWNTTSIGPDNNSTVIVPQPGVAGAWVRLAISETSPVNISTIANLQAFEGGAGSAVVFVEGYYNPADGGGGMYVYIPTDTTSPSNGGTIIIDALGHRYYLAYTGVLSVKQFGAKGNGTTDDTAAFKAAIEAAPGILYVPTPSNFYLTSSPLDLNNFIIEGGGQQICQIQSNDPNVNNPVIYMGESSVLRNIGVGFTVSSITGSETIGQRVGILTFSLATGFSLQRGGAIINVKVLNVGTGIYDYPNGCFSCNFENIEIANFSYRGWDFEALERTGNVYNNIYVNNYSFSQSPDGGFRLAGHEFETTFGQINVEGLTAGYAISLSGLQAINGGTFHIEEFTQKNTFAPAFIINESAGYIGSISIYFSPINTAGWFALELENAINPYGSVQPNYTSNYIRIGTFNMVGLNSSGGGLSGLSNFQFVDREVATSAGNYYLQIDCYTWSNFNSDSSVYEAFPNDPHNLIQSIATVSGPPIGKLTAATGYVRRQDGMIEMWGTVSVGANATVTVTLPTLNGSSTAGFPTACVFQEAQQNDTSTSSTYRFNASPVSASQIDVSNTAGSTVTGFWRALGY